MRAKNQILKVRTVGDAKRLEVGEKSEAVGSEICVVGEEEVAEGGRFGEMEKGLVGEGGASLKIEELKGCGEAGKGGVVKGAEAEIES
jgi:hypothetical protein